MPPEFSQGPPESSQGMSRSIDPMTKDKAGYGPRAAPRTHRLDESAAGYSLAGWSPPEPTSASPASLTMLPFGWIRYAFSVNCNTSLISWPRLRGPPQSSAPKSSCLSPLLSPLWGPLQSSAPKSSCLSPLCPLCLSPLCPLCLSPLCPLFPWSRVTEIRAAGCLTDSRDSIPQVLVMARTRRQRWRSTSGASVSPRWVSHPRIQTPHRNRGSTRTEVSCHRFPRAGLPKLAHRLDRRSDNLSLALKIGPIRCLAMDCGIRLIHCPRQPVRALNRECVRKGIIEHHVPVCSHLTECPHRRIVYE